MFVSEKSGENMKKYAKKWNWGKYGKIEKKSFWGQNWHKWTWIVMYDGGVCMWMVEIKKKIV